MIWAKEIEFIVLDHPKETSSGLNRGAFTDRAGG